MANICINGPDFRTRFPGYDQYNRLLNQYNNLDPYEDETEYKSVRSRKYRFDCGLKQNNQQQRHLILRCKKPIVTSSNIEKGIIVSDDDYKLNDLYIGIASFIIADDNDESKLLKNINDNFVTSKKYTNSHLNNMVTLYLEKFNASISDETMRLSKSMFISKDQLNNYFEWCEPSKTFGEFFSKNANLFENEHLLFAEYIGDADGLEQNKSYIVHTKKNQTDKTKTDVKVFELGGDIRKDDKGNYISLKTKQFTFSKLNEFLEKFKPLCRIAVPVITASSAGSRRNKRKPRLVRSKRNIRVRRKRTIKL
jgi:hypothetical protein